MPPLLSISPTEALFAERANGLLPFDQAMSYRNEAGCLVYHWDAPCEEVSGLWVTIYDQKEIILSSRLSHMHVERWEIAREVTAEGQIWAKLIDKGIAEARDILIGETVFIKRYDADGNEQSSSGMWTRRQWTEQQSSDARARQRAWNWFGEVVVG